MAKKDSKLCFVIGPIGAHKSSDRIHADALLNEIIKPTFAKHFRTFKVQRADHISRPGMIDSQIITALFQADLVVADLTSRNANAFYELGIRHVLQKPVIHLYRRGDIIPADIAPHRAIEFSYEDKLNIREAKTALRKSIIETLSPEFVVENPVTRSRAFQLKPDRNSPRRKAPKNISGRRRPRFVTPPPEFVVDGATGVQWTPNGRKWMAFWVAPRASAKRGFKPIGCLLWSGEEMSALDKEFILVRSKVLQDALQEWEGERLSFV